eukprot:s6871_g5.t1
MAASGSADGPQAQDVPVHSNPLSPTAGGATASAAANEQRLMQVLESVTLLLQNQAAAAASASSASSGASSGMLTGCVHKDFAADITRIRANLSRPIALETLTAEEEIAIAFRDFGRFAS